LRIIQKKEYDGGNVKETLKIYAGQGYLTDSKGQKVKEISFDKVIKEYESAPEDFQFNN
jgi:hypothetical protein